MTSIPLWYLYLAPCLQLSTSTSISSNLRGFSRCSRYIARTCQPLITVSFIYFLVSNVLCNATVGNSKARTLPAESSITPPAQFLQQDQAHLGTWMGSVDANAPFLSFRRRGREHDLTFERKTRASSVLGSESERIHRGHKVKPVSRFSSLLDALASIRKHQRYHLKCDRVSPKSVKHWWRLFSFLDLFVDDEVCKHCGVLGMQACRWWGGVWAGLGLFLRWVWDATSWLIVLSGKSTCCRFGWYYTLGQSSLSCYLESTEDLLLSRSSWALFSGESACFIIASCGSINTWGTSEAFNVFWYASLAFFQKLLRFC